MKPEIKKLLILNAPYLLFVYLFDSLYVAMVYLNDVPVDCHFPQIAFHVPGGDELHFLLNQCPFFLGYSEFDLCCPFPAAHAALLSPCKEGLGHFPTSNFQPPLRRAQGAKIRKGYPFPMLAIHLFVFSHDESADLPNTSAEKEKRHRNNPFP